MNSYWILSRGWSSQGCWMDFFVVFVARSKEGGLFPRLGLRRGASAKQNDLPTLLFNWFRRSHVCLNVYVRAFERPISQWPLASFPNRVAVVQADKTFLLTRNLFRFDSSTTPSLFDSFLFEVDTCLHSIRLSGKSVYYHSRSKNC